MTDSLEKFNFDATRIGFLPNKYKNNTPEMLEPIGKMELFKEAMNGQSFYLMGGPGTGKTFFGLLVAKYMTGKHEDLHGHLKVNKAVRYISFPSFILQLQSSFNNKVDAFDLLNDEVKDPRFLLIDDFGAEGLTDFVRRSVYFMINERDLSGRQTIITSNYSLGEIDKQIDARISSRISGMCEIVEMTGADKRIKR